MTDRSKNRSDRYQWVLIECPCSPEMMTEVCDSDGIGAQLNPWGYNEELFELKDKLKAAFWRIVDTQLTSRQKEVIHLYAEGLTQTEIAKKLNVNQSSITKSINGNCDYRNGRKVYGGARKKLRKIADKDEEIKEILDRIADLQSNNY
jgi:DNA-binding CsgD family transcriptional regulator